MGLLLLERLVLVCFVWVLLRNSLKWDSFRGIADFVTFVSSLLNSLKRAKNTSNDRNESSLSGAGD